MGNPFAIAANGVWLDWFRNNHVDSTLTWLKAHPTTLLHPNQNDMETGNLIHRLLWNEAFVEKLSDKGLQVWMASPVIDFIEEMFYQTIIPKSKISRIIHARLWFERVYIHLRNSIMAERGMV